MADNSELPDGVDIPAELKFIEGFGVDELIMRNSNAIYQIGSSPHILNVQQLYDAEATVIVHLPGQGRNSVRW